MSNATRKAARAARWRRLRDRVSPDRPLFVVGLDGPVGGARVEEALLEAAERGDFVLRAGELTHVELLHDDACPTLRGGRRCRCRPDVVPHTRGAA